MSKTTGYLPRRNTHRTKQETHGRLQERANTNSRDEGKDQESIQSSTIPVPVHHMGKQQKH